MTPADIAEMRTFWCTPRNEGSLISADVAGLLDEIERLRGEVAKSHQWLRYQSDGWCQCRWTVAGYPMEQAEQFHAEHVAAILNGGAS